MGVRVWGLGGFTVSQHVAKGTWHNMIWIESGTYTARKTRFADSYCTSIKTMFADEQRQTNTWGKKEACSAVMRRLKENG